MNGDVIKGKQLLIRSNLHLNHNQWLLLIQETITLANTIFLTLPSNYPSHKLIVTLFLFLIFETIFWLGDVKIIWLDMKSFFILSSSLKKIFWNILPSLLHSILFDNEVFPTISFQMLHLSH